MSPPIFAGLLSRHGKYLGDIPHVSSGGRVSWMMMMLLIIMVITRIMMIMINYKFSTESLPELLGGAHIPLIFEVQLTGNTWGKKSHFPVFCEIP